MKKYDDFINNILPGNYFLTKSMEIGKTDTSGTLWYTKKFIVWYNYIFLEKNLDTHEYITSIKNIFEEYINSLDDKVKAEAKTFFFPQNDLINCSSKEFKSFSKFCGDKEFDTLREKKDYIESAKKYYFSFVMDAGGQSGVNKHIKENFLFLKDSTYDQIDNVILNYFNSESVNLVRKRNDYHAFLRNERQILYYYGFFHSKSNGAKDKEFSSLTPIGTLALKANSMELMCIWEHQKLKMISQPVNVDITKMNVNEDEIEMFGILNSPYIDIIKYLHFNQKMTLDTYQYIVSRNKENCFIDFSDKEIIKDLLKNLDDVKSKIKLFNRSSDMKVEDSNKEIKKYILGIRSDLKKDLSTNVLSFCELKSGMIIVNDKVKLAKIYEYYNTILEYKNKKYGMLFNKCNEELKNVYSHNNSNIAYDVNSKVKISWDLYNMQPDKFILLSVACSIVNCIDVGKTLSIDDYVQKFNELFKQMFKKIGITSTKIIKNELKLFFESKFNNDLTIYIDINKEDRPDITTANINIPHQDLFEKIKSLSETNDLVYNEERKRNTNLVSLLKKYYIQINADELNLLKCECCNETTFITTSDEPYVEFHHLIPFGGGNYGPDHYLNLFALCSSCHRKLHYIKLDEKKGLYESINENNHLHESFLERLKKLKEENLLKSYHLEFLLADNAINQDMYNEIVN